MIRRLKAMNDLCQDCTHRHICVHVDSAKELITNIKEVGKNAGIFSISVSCQHKASESLPSLRPGYALKSDMEFNKEN